MATMCKAITHLIYASGNPMGRVMSIVAQNRAIESDTDSTRYTDDVFNYWTSVVENNQNIDDFNGDTYKATYTFSLPPIDYLKKLTIPVLICYGSKDWSALFNDYLRIEIIRQKKTNFTFSGYISLEHNFFRLKKNGKPDFENGNWDRVVKDWQNWLETK